VTQVKFPRNPLTVHAPLAAYAHQIELRGDERLLVLSGQVGITPDGELPEDAGQQLGVALDNVLRNLDEASMGVDHLVKLTFYYVERIEPARRAQILETRLRGRTPCMTLLYVAGLASPKLKVEVDAWASR
jgi:enamine deaminase RidA (YjgF/YER057c/UK114 family)